jgi:threonine dehydrogenase-like Zn-dependent dehydrogenase
VRAACYAGDRTLNFVEREPLAPAEGEVAIDVAYTGICGTDLHILHGAMDKRVTMPAVLGHEMAGTVSALGAGVESLVVGEHVTVMPLGNCGDCPACRSGNTHISGFGFGFDHDLADA